MSKIRILLTGGGSGGHIYALIAVAEAFKKQAQILDLSLDLRYFGDPQDYKIYFEAIGIKITHISSSKLRRYFSLLSVMDLIKFLWSVPQSLFKIFWFMPDVVFSKGGSGAIAVLYVCRFYRIPIIIHDSDAVPGLTTCVSAKFASLIELAFASAVPYFKDQSKTRVVGHPVRSSVQVPSSFSTIEQAEAKFNLKFDPQKPLLLILGGSQGAQTINNFILKNLKEFLKEFQILHQVGSNNFLDYKNNLKVASGLTEVELQTYHTTPFLDNDYRVALIAADIVISRAGAGTIFELAAAGKPAILIPITESANDHQRENAFNYAATGAATVITEENLFASLVIREINVILKDPVKLQKMQESAKNFYKPNAASDIAEDIFACVSHSGEGRRCP